MTIDLLQVQAALTPTWGGRDRLTAMATFQDNRLPIDIQRLTVEAALAGAPASVLLKSVSSSGAAGKIE